MAVYVDDMKAKFRNMTMCHMMADTTEELLEMASKIGVQHKWIQDAGTPREHFDIAMSKRALALKAGAQEIDRNKLVEIIRAKRQAAEVSP